ncbi:PQQ-dependent sugar dehydrogenase [Haladaptatus cibarius]|uniref:PQQ-dependent sugar dehydrogenase n=1 Tax=Haladaptatus cibarius TaxID=453847 RepID=UPI0006791301|nr:PQQ-dependent sugar dehydrogenase [Haladaptatus cibarius]
MRRQNEGVSRRRFLRTAIGGATVFGSISATRTEATQRPAIPTGASIGVQKVADEPLTQPVGFETAAEVGHQYIIDQIGRIYVLDGDGIADEPFLDVRDRLKMRTDFSDERGLLGLALHPNFRTNRRFYVRYSAPPGTSTPPKFDHTAILSEFQANEDLLAANPESERRILGVPEPQANHNAGDIVFGPDGYLYVPLGDGGGASDTGRGHASDWYTRNRGGNGQDVTRNLLGSILRLDVDDRAENKPYAIPDDNPLVGKNGLPEVWAWGLRNPWRLSFSGDELFVADVGQRRFEEVNLVEAGDNYGWNVREGTYCFNANAPKQRRKNCPGSARGKPPHDGQQFADPIIEYPHKKGGQAVGLAVIGGYVYDGSALQNRTDDYIFGDWSRSFRSPRGRLFFASRPNTSSEQWPVREFRIAGSENGELNRYVLAFGRGGNGELFVLTSETNSVTGSGGVYKLVPPDEGDAI